jgi:photosystem II stability/assembly factor-like uncharacterized protein
MRLLFLLLALLLSASAVLAADTTLVTVLKDGQFGGDLRDFSFPTATTGYAVGDDGSEPLFNFIARTTDGGVTWTRLNTPLLNQRPWSVAFANRDTGLVGGYAGMILRTTNGGSAWTMTNTGGTSANIYDIAYASRDTVFACGTSSGTVLRSVDGGQTWTALAPPTVTTRYGIAVYSPQEVVIVGSSGNTIRTTDAGATWNTAAAGATTLYGVARSGSSLIAVNSTQAAYRSTDRGASWTLLFDRGSSPLYAVHHADSLRGFMVGSNGVNYRTADGWATYDSVLVSRFTAQVCFAARMTGPATIHVGGSMGNLYLSTNGGATWTTTESGTRYYALDFADSLNGVAVGWRGTVVKTSDAGRTWTELRGINGFEAYDVQMFSPASFVVGSAGGRLYKTTDGGNTFVERPLPVLTAGSVKTLRFLTENVGFASGEMGRIYHTTNGGASWDSIYYTGASFNNIEDIVFVGDSVGFAVGERGRVWTTTNRLSWDSAGISRPAVLTLWEAAFLSRSSGYVDSQDGKIFRTTNGGATWATVSDTAGLAGRDVIDIALADSMRGYAVAEGGILFRMATPTRWVVDRVVSTLGVPDNLWGIDFVTPRLAYISGYYGTIYRLDVVPLTSVADGALPQEYSLDQNYPNPFNPVTTIGFTLPAQGRTRLTVYDLLGRQVASLLDEDRAAGRHQIRFDARNLSSGTYFYRLESGTFTSTRKLILLR